MIVAAAGAFLAWRQSRVSFRVEGLHDHAVLNRAAVEAGTVWVMVSDGAAPRLTLTWPTSWPKWRPPAERWPCGSRISMTGFAYGVPEVQAQIDAAHELGVESWLLWNPDTIYTEAALSPITG
jgi:Putative glycosyl hydrolase domain